MSQTELAASLGTVWGTVSKWERRGGRAIPPEIAAAAMAAIERLGADRADPFGVAIARVRTALAECPGASGRQLVLAAGYGKANQVAHAALRELVDTGEAHARPAPNRGGIAQHCGVFPGPARADSPELKPIGGAVLRRQRSAAGLRQADLASQLGVTQTAVAYWERHAAPAYRSAAISAALAQSGLTTPLNAAPLRQMRRRGKVSQGELAARLGVTQAAVSRWERVGVPGRRAGAVRAALSA